MSESPLRWHATGRAIAEEGEGVASGDVHLVADFDGGVLLALIDGLGHGDLAAEAAQTASAIARAHASAPVTDIIEACHAGLKATRGAVMTVASIRFTDARLTWAGVGNVEALLERASAGVGATRETPMLRGGIVGYQLPPLHASALDLAPGDTLVMVTDGIRQSFTDLGYARRPVRDLAEAVLDQHARGNDDAHVLVARYRGSADA